MTVGDSVGGIVADSVGALRVTMTAKKRRRSNISLMLVENIIFRWKPMKSLAVPFFLSVVLCYASMGIGLPGPVGAAAAL